MAGTLFALTPFVLLHGVFARDIHSINLASSSPSSQSSDWTMFSFNHSRFNANEHILSTRNVSRLSLDWSTAVTPDNASSDSAAIANGIVYTSNRDTSPNDSLAALQMTTGHILWQSMLSGDLASPPAVMNGRVYITSQPWIQAFNATTGHPLWQDNINAETAPVVANGVVYIGSYAINGPYNTIYALNATTGKIIWTTTIDGIVGTDSPTIANGTLYIGSEQGTLYAFNASTGKQRWSASTGTNTFATGTPAVDNGAVYAQAGPQNLEAFNTATGKQLWSVTVGDYSSPAAAYGLVYMTDTSNSLRAYSEKTGKLVWEYTTANPDGSVDGTLSPAVANGVVYASGFGGYSGMIALNAKTGKLLDTYSNPGQGDDSSSPSIADGMVFYNAGDGSVDALYVHP
jgi:outer membrane protein assembly factor BamB